jgi:hypothetical protein
VAVGLMAGVAEGASNGWDLVAAFVSFTGFIATLLRFDFFVISPPPWNSRTIRVFREE